MNFEGKKIKYEASRVIGLNDADLEKLNKASEVVNTTVNQEVVVESQPTSNVVAEPQLAPEMVSQISQTSSVAPNETVVNTVIPEAVVQPEIAPETVVSDVIDAVKSEETNIFDQKPEVAPSLEETNIFDAPEVKAPIQTPEMANEVQVPNVDIPAINVENNVNTEVVEPANINPTLETPAEFYQTEAVKEVPINNAEIDNTFVYLDEIKKSIESKNEIIKALKEKNSLLSSENARLSEELKVATQRMTIAEEQRRTQVAGTPIQNTANVNNVQKTLNPTQAA